MKASELREKSGDDLQKELEALLRAQFGLRMQVATQQLSNTSQLKKTERDIARVRTIMTRKGREMSPEAASSDAPCKNQRQAESAASSATRCRRP